MTTTDAPDNDSPFAGGGFDLYGAGKRRRGGLRRVTPATTAAPNDGTSPARVAEEPRSFNRSFGFSGRARPTTSVAGFSGIDEPSEPIASASAPMSYVGPAVASEDEALLMPQTPLYARTPVNRNGNLNRIIFPAVVVLAAAAIGGWYLTQSHPTANEATVTTTTTASNTAMAPSAPYVAPGGASVMPAPAPVAAAPIADPTAAVNLSAPARLTTETAAMPARIARAQASERGAMARRAAARTSRPARNAADNTADVAATAPANVAPAPEPIAAPSPPPMIAAPVAAPAMTPPVDPTGAVNPPAQ